MEQPTPSRDELAKLEAIVVDALKIRDDSTLNILGYGEVSVALGWPIEEPRFVCKRTPPFTRSQFTAYEDLVNEYINKIRAGGVQVVDTTLVSLDQGTKVVAYLVQPLLESASLGHNILRVNKPDADHPFLAALAESLDVVTPTLSIDAQVGNFAWDGASLTLVDVGTPFLWDGVGSFRMDMTPFARMLPSPVRPLAVREMTKLVTRWNDPRRVGLDIVANLYREGLPEWVDPTVTALNRHLEQDNGVTPAEAKDFYKEDLSFWPALKKAQAVERWWQTKVRREPYDWFIYSSFG